MVALVLLLLPFSACGDAGGGAVVSPGTGTFLFGVRGIPDAEGQFVAVTSDPGVLAKLASELALPATQRLLHIQGPIALGNGGHNLSWGWHFLPGQWDIVEASTEVCDGTPRLVESDLTYWIKEVGAFCPWNSYVERRL